MMVTTVPRVLSLLAGEASFVCIHENEELVQMVLFHEFQDQWLWFLGPIPPSLLVSLAVHFLE